MTIKNFVSDSRNAIFIVHETNDFIISQQKSILDRENQRKIIGLNLNSLDTYYLYQWYSWKFLKKDEAIKISSHAIDKILTIFLIGFLPFTRRDFLEKFSEIDFERW